MKHLLLTTIAAVVLVGCGSSVDIWTAAYDGNIEAVKQHLAAGTDVNAKRSDGMTPLPLAAQFGRKEVAEMLIAKDADVNARKKNGYTPLDEANWRNKPEIADLLREHGGKDGRRIEGTDASLGAAWAVCVQLCCGGREGLRGSGFV